MAKPKPEAQSPQTAPSEQKGVTDADLKSKGQDLGILGKIFGSRDHSPGNIAGFAIVVSFVALVLIIFAPDSASFPKKDLATLFSGIITLTLGFLFGRSTNG